MHLGQVQARENTTQHAVTFNSCLDKQLTKENFTASESDIKESLQETSKVELSRVCLFLNYSNFENILNACQARLTAFVLKICREGCD